MDYLGRVKRRRRGVYRDRGGAACKHHPRVLVKRQVRPVKHGDGDQTGPHTHLLPIAARFVVAVAFAGHEFHRRTAGCAIPGWRLGPVDSVRRRGPRRPAAAAASISQSHKFSIAQLPLSYCKMRIICDAYTYVGRRMILTGQSATRSDNDSSVSTRNITSTPVGGGHNSLDTSPIVHSSCLPLEKVRRGYLPTNSIVQI